jgi:hypothetical protein
MWFHVQCTLTEVGRVTYAVKKDFLKEYFCNRFVFNKFEHFSWSVNLQSMGIFQSTFHIGMIFWKCKVNHTNLLQNLYLIKLTIIKTSNYTDFDSCHSDGSWQVCNECLSTKAQSFLVGSLALRTFFLDFMY